MSRTPLVAGNWKLHNGLADSAKLARAVKSAAASTADVDIVLAPVFTALSTVAEALSGSRVRLGAQNCYWENQGAFTGEVSAKLLRDVGCEYVIVGHSERRQLFGETDANVAKRTRAALDHGLIPIVCVGETLAEREKGQTLSVVLGQVQKGLEGLDAQSITQCVVAYEPVWAIGTGRNASPGDAQEVHAAIRAQLGQLSSPTTAAAVRILYGGSVKPDNAKSLMEQPDIDGALVGGASLAAESFMAIVRAAAPS